MLVPGRHDLLPALAQVPVIPLSTQIRGFGWEVVLGESDGVPAPCVLKPEWIMSVECTALGPRLATLPAARWPGVGAALLDATDGLLGYARPEMVTEVLAATKDLDDAVLALVDRVRLPSGDLMDDVTVVLVRP